MAGGQGRDVTEYIEQRVVEHVREAVATRWGGSLGSARMTASGAIYSNGREVTKSAKKEDATLARRQEEAWAAYDEIGEVTTLVDGTSGLLSQCRFYVGKTIRDGDKWVDVPADQVPGVSAQDAALAEATLARFTDETGSQAGLIRSISQNWSVVGATKLVGYALSQDGDPIEQSPNAPLPNGAVEVWQAVAPTSLRVERAEPNTWKLAITERESLKLTNPIVYELRWTHPRWPGQALGWVMSAIDVCRDLRAFTGGQRSAARSGIPADLLLAPSEANPKKPAQLGLDMQDDGLPDAQDANDDFATYIERLIGEFIMDVIADMDSGAAAVPGVLTVGQDFIEKFKTLSFARAVDRGLSELVNQARDRLAEQADCPPEMLRGLGSTNRWNGGQIADDEYRRYFRPKGNAIADAFTAWPLRHGLLAVQRVDIIDKLGLRVLVDPSEAVASPDYSKLVLGLVDRAVIGHSGALEILNLPASLAPSPKELALIKELKSAGKTQAADNPGRGDQGPPADSSPVDQTKGQVVVAGHVVDRPAALAARPSPLGDRLLRIEVETRARLIEACEAALDRAIDRAGAKLRSWARKAGLGTSDGPGYGFATLIGPVRARQLADANPTTREEMWQTSLDSLVVSFERIGLDAYSAAQSVIGETVPQAEIDAALARASTALIDGMMELADQQVFGPIGSPTSGEQVTLRVPTSLVRRVLAIAGGALGVGAGLDPDAQAAFGLAFGPLLDRITPDHDGLVWVYGDGVRMVNFEPHRGLDGQRFDSTSDGGLGGSVFASLGPYWFPGDHVGCQCSWKLLYMEPE